MKTHLVFSGVALILALGCGTSGGPDDFGSGGGGDDASGGSDTGSGGVGGGGVNGGSGGVDKDVSDEDGLGEEGGGGVGGGGVGGGGAGGGGVGGGGVGGAPGGVDADFGYDAPDYQNDKEKCVDLVVGADLIPLDIYFMIDVSTSMSDPMGYGDAGDCDAVPPFTSPTVPSRWCRAINGIAGYVSSPEAKGNRVAIQYFKPFVSGYKCDGTVYRTPMVPFVALPGGALTGDYSGQAVAIVGGYGGLNWAKPHSNTPTAAALRGLTQFTASHKEGGRTTIGIMVTDGIPTRGPALFEPDACAPNADTDLRKLAGDNFVASGSHTFFVGITGSDFKAMETWASYTGAMMHPNVSGSCGNGAATCSHYNIGTGDPKVFKDALLSIQKSVMSCTFGIPDVPTGIPNIDFVDVIYNKNSEPPDIELPKVSSKPACTGPGWYFDDPDKPTTINLCPDSCDAVGADPHPSVNVRIPCEGT